jgi:hypothetical protein
MIYHILNLGADVQSTTVALLRTFDVAIFADTQEEPEAVYPHLGCLKSTVSYPILIRTAGKLGHDLCFGKNSTGGRFAAIPAFTTDGISIGQTRRQCTKEYKTEVIGRAIHREVNGLAKGCAISRNTEVHLYFGISRDEARRSIKIRQNVEKRRGWFAHFPLLDLGWTRADCLRWHSTRVPHAVPQSACVFCPYKSDAELLKLKRTDPQGWSRAEEIDAALHTPGRVVNRDMRQTMYLHRSCKPLPEVDLNERQYSIGFAAECEGMCGV